MNRHKNIDEAMVVLAELGMPRAQQNERSALCLLALAAITPDKSWKDAEAPLVGITPMMDFSRDHYGRSYAPNTRETFRRQTIHQFVAAGIALYNPDNPSRPVNSPKAVYQLSPETLALLRVYGSPSWKRKLCNHLRTRVTLKARYEKDRKLARIPVSMGSGTTLHLSPGRHNALSKAVIESFVPRFVPGAILVYVGDTGNKWAFYDKARLNSLGVTVDVHGKMPDVVLYCPDRNWLLLVESVTSHGPVDGKRHEELAALFAPSSAGLVYVTAFPNRRLMGRYLSEIAWETEVWCADSPSHMIHFNGERFLGPRNNP